MSRVTECSCGALRLTVSGEPVRVSVCHCFACQRRTGSAFGAQARFPLDAVTVEGEPRRYSRVSDAGEERTFSFCGECGATVFYEVEGVEGFISIPLGAFGGWDGPAPSVEVWEKRRVPWVEVRRA